MSPKPADPSPTQESYDAVIIGAGVIGCAIGFELARRGRRVVLVDREAGPGQGSTSYSSAIIRFSYSTEAGVAAAWEGMHYWADWADYLGVDDPSGLARFEQCGMVILSPGTGAHDEKVRALWDALDIPYEMWSPEELVKHLPILDAGRYGPATTPDDDAFWRDADGELAGALYSPPAGYVNDPQLATHNLFVAAQAHGAEGRFRSTVTGVIVEDDRCVGVRLSDGTELRGRAVVNVAGPHSSAVNELAGVDMAIKTRAMREEVHHAPAPAGFAYYGDGMNVADEDLGLYLRPEVGNNVVVGSLNPPCDDREFVDPDDFDETITAEQFERQLLRANRRVPELGIPHRRMGIVGLYDVSDDWIPIYDRTDLDGYYVAIGTSGNQFKNAGVAGHLMAELIIAVEAGHDHDADPLVVPGRYTGLPLEMATFRRNRPVHANSSMGVNG